MKNIKENFDKSVIDDFGYQWEKFDQKEMFLKNEPYFRKYFSLLPKKYLNKEIIAFDAGCGSGRWAMFIAPLIKTLHCIDPSDKALNVAKKNLANNQNCIFECSTINSSKIKEGTMDFGYSLGVLHHIPDTLSALESCVKKLKKGAPFLLYIYYRFDNKPFFYFLIWKLSDLLRKKICELPFKLKSIITNMIALFVYYPLARFSWILNRIGIFNKNFPLYEYRNISFYFMSNDALDRFGTKLEKRFTKKEIKIMMTNSGLEKISFRDDIPFWVAIGYKK